MKIMKLRSKKVPKSISKVGNNGGNCCSKGEDKNGCVGHKNGGGDIKWELRPGGMLVQKREDNNSSGNVVKGEGEGIITIKVSTVATCHDIPIQATSTFGELKGILAMVTTLEPKEQRLLFKGKEREDGEHLHMVGVRDKDKVLLLQDPAIKERKLLGNPVRTISV